MKRLRFVNSIIFALSLIAVMLLWLSAEHSSARDKLCDFGWCPTSTAASDWNEVFFGLSLGTLTSAIFYIIVVRVPEERERSFIKHHLKLRYDIFKRVCIENFLWMAGLSAPSDLVDELLDQKKFRDFFSQPHADNDSNWYAVLNNMDDDGLNDIKLIVLNFQNELEFALARLRWEGEEPFAVRDLANNLMTLSRTENDYDSEKLFGRLMWKIFAGWDWIKGYEKQDSIEKLIQRL